MQQSALSVLNERIPRPVRRELARPELLRCLTEHEGTLAALVAPAGYGKTTLLAQYARSHEGRVVWLTLSEDDSDPRILATRLASALHRTAPTLTLPHWQQAQEGSSEGLASALASDLTNSTTNFEFILDGSDMLRETAGVWLGRWINELPEGHRVLLAGRAEPPLDLARRVALGEALLIDLRALAFSPAETAACLGEWSQKDSSPESVHALLEGWPVGVALIGSGAAPQLTPHDLIRDVLGYLPRPLRDLLPGASVLDIWSESGEQHLGLPLHWLQEVRLAGLPLIPLGGSYRPHQLLRDALDGELRRQPAQYQALHLQEGERAERAGERLRALHHYLRADALQQALTLAAELAGDYATRWEHRLLLQMLEQFPGHQLPPALQRLLGYALIETGGAARGAVLLHRLRDAGDRSPDLLASLGLLAARAGQWAEELALAEEGLLAADTPRDRGRLLRIRGHALLMLGRQPEASAVLQQAIDLAQARGDPLDLGASLMQMAQVYQLADLQGPLEATVRRAISIYSELGMPSRMGWLHNDLASLLRRQGRFTEALEVIAQALPLAEAEQSVEVALLLETRADVYLWQGDVSSAMGPYRDAFRLCPRFGADLLASRIAPLLTESALLAGDRAVAQEALNWIRQSAQGSPDRFRSSRTFCEGLWAAAEQDWASARRHFTLVYLPGTEPGLVSQQRARLHGARAACELGLLLAGDAEQLQTAFSEVPAYAFFAGDGPALQRIAEQCHARGWPADALVRLSSELTTGEGTRPDLPPPLVLNLQMLGPLRVSLNGQPLHLPLSKSAEILAWLALHGPGSRDQLVDALWDGSNERRHSEYFKVAVRHLRAALTTPSAVTFNPLPYSDGVYRLAEQFVLECDAAQAKQALSGQSPEALRRAVDGYGGPFLPSTETQWAERVRLQVLEATVTAALLLGTQLEQVKPAEAAQLYERAIELEPLSEEAYVRLIQLQVSRLDQTSAQHAFIRYRRMLAEEWGRPPRAEWTRMFDRV